MKATNNTPTGTSFYNVQITTTPLELKRVAERLDADYSENNTGEDKSNYDFTFETAEGDVFTIYDWKKGRTLRDNEQITFNIGSKDEMISHTAKQELFIEIAKLEIEVRANTMAANQRFVDETALIVETKHGLEVHPLSEKDVEYLTFELEQEISAYCTKQDLPEGLTVEELLETYNNDGCSITTQLRKFDKELKQLGVVSH